MLTIFAIQRNNLLSFALDNQHQYDSPHITRPNPHRVEPKESRQKTYDDLPRHRLNIDGMVAARAGEESMESTRFLVFSGFLPNNFTILCVSTHVVLRHECGKGREKREHSRPLLKIVRDILRVHSTAPMLTN